MKRLLIALAMGTAAIVSHAPRVHAEAEDDLRDGDKFFEEGDWKKAATAYDRAISKAPSQVSAEAYGKRAAIFIILKDYKGGLDFVATAKGRYPNAAEIMEQEALLLLGLVMEARCTQFVDPLFSYIAKIHRKWLAKKPPF